MTERGFSKSRLERMHAVLAAHIERGVVPGVALGISRGGDTHIDALGVKTLGRPERIAPDSIFRIASITKPMAATAAMILVEECKLRLDEPIDRLLPELADRKVLKRLDGPLDETVPAQRPISLRDLLTCRMGFGMIMEPSQNYPLHAAIAKTSISVGPQLPTSRSMDEYAGDLGSLPWMHQPGKAWRYDTSFEALGVLLERAARQPLDAFMRERIFEPLGMKDTSFRIAREKLGRFPTCYQRKGGAPELEVFDDPSASAWSRPPGFCSGGGGLVSTVEDCLAFGRMLLEQGKLGSTRVLSRASVALMTTDHIPPEQKASSPFAPDFWDKNGWGFGLGISTRRDQLEESVGSFGWAGGYGTRLHVDPREDLVAVFMSQRVFDSALPLAFMDFGTLLYQALDD